MLISVLTMVLLASDVPKATPECLAAAQRAVDVWEDVSKGTSREGSMADAIQKLGKQRNLERVAAALFENQKMCVFYAKETSDILLRMLAIKQIPDHPEHGVTQRKVPFDPQDMKALVMQPPSGNGLQTLATPETLKELSVANLTLSNCNYPGLTIVDSVLVSGTGYAVATAMGLDKQQYQDRFMRPALHEMAKEDACWRHARLTRAIAQKVKDLGARIISDTRKTKSNSIMLSP